MFECGQGVRKLCSVDSFLEKRFVNMFQEHVPQEWTEHFALEDLCNGTDFVYGTMTTADRGANDHCQRLRGSQIRNVGEKV